MLSVVPDYTLRQLEYFVAVADAGTVTGAAAKVHLSQSAMSTALAELERTLGVQLVLRRHARGITLTPAGQHLLVEARQLLAQAGDLESLASNLGGEVTGELTLGCFAILAPYVVPELLTSAATQLPDLTLHTVEESHDQLEEGLLSGRIELALGYDLAEQPELDKQELCSVAPHVVLPVAHRLARRRKVSLTALASEPLVLLDLPHSRDYFARLFDAAGVTPVVRHRTHSAELARALAARGGCYTLLNLRPRTSVSIEGLPYAAIPLDVPLPPAESHLSVVLMRVSGSRPTRRAQALAGVCRAVVPALMKQN
jgi:DNA-binding transcriptional LysR family regulator